MNEIITIDEENIKNKIFDIKVSINIINVFVNMRKLISNNTDEKFNKLFEAIEEISITAQLELDIKYMKKFDVPHDRFLILDANELYHIGASLKDLGKQRFVFSKFDIESFDILSRFER